MGARPQHTGPAKPLEGQKLPKHYCRNFFIAVGGCVLALRTWDVHFVAPDAPRWLDPLFHAVLNKVPYLSHHVGFAGLVGFLAFLVSCVGFTVLDLTHSVSTKVQKDWWPSVGDMAATALPQIAIYAVLNWAGYAYSYRRLHMPTHAPSLARFAAELTEAFVCGDFFIYWEHRIMHAVPYLRNNIHSWHHYYHAPFGWAGGHVHPLEDAIVVLCQTTAPLVLGHHPFSFWVFVGMWTVLLVEEHSGHDVWWAPYNWLPYARCPMGGGAAPHDIHHYKVNKNYAFVLCVWDHLFGSFESVVCPPATPDNKKSSWWEFTSRSNMAQRSG